MDKDEAIAAMKEGKSVTHKLFYPDEWMTMKDGQIVFEDGCKCDMYDFWFWRNDDESWLTDWRIYGQ